MICYREKDYEDKGMPRSHPYDGASYDARVAYYDFRKHPSLIREKLENFKPFDRHDGIQKFYELVEWINSRESFFESNDCCFDEPFPRRSHTSSDKALECHGRLLIFFNNLEANLQDETTEWLRLALDKCINEADVGYEDGIIGLCFFNTMFEEVNDQIGRELAIRFWVFGETEIEIYLNLGRTFVNLLEALKAVNREISRQGTELDR